MFLTVKKIRKRKLGSKLFSPYYPPAYCQKYFDSLLDCYYKQLGTKQWNYTINPNPRGMANNIKTYSQLTDKQLFSHYKKNIKSDIILNKAIMPYIREYLIFFEYGDKNGKPHCNLVLLMEPETPDKIKFFISNRLKIYGTSNYTINFKDQKQTFKSPDIYNQKDVSFMYSLGIKPIYAVNKNSYSRLKLMQSIKNI